MTEVIRCRCGQRYRIGADFTAKRVKCLKCGKQLPMPQADEEKVYEVHEYLVEEEDFDEFDDEEVAKPVSKRTSRSRRKSRQRALQFASQMFGQVWRELLRTVMTLLGIITMPAAFLFLGSPLFAVPICMMCILGLAGVNGRGIAVSRNYRIEGDPALIVGSILISVGGSLPALWVYLILGRMKA